MAAKMIATPVSFLNEGSSISVNVNIAVSVNGGDPASGTYPVPVMFSDSRADIYKKIEDVLLDAYSTVGLTKQDLVIL